MVGAPASAVMRTEPAAAHYQSNMSGNYSDNDPGQQTMRAALDKKTLKIAYLESENRNLEQMVDDL